MNSMFVLKNELQENFKCPNGSFVQYFPKFKYKRQVQRLKMVISINALWKKTISYSSEICKLDSL